MLWFCGTDSQPTAVKWHEVCKQVESCSLLSLPMENVIDKIMFLTMLYQPMFLLSLSLLLLNTCTCSSWDTSILSALTLHHLQLFNCHRLREKFSLALWLPCTTESIPQISWACCIHENIKTLTDAQCSQERTLTGYSSSLPHFHNSAKTNTARVLTVFGCIGWKSCCWEETGLRNYFKLFHRSKLKSYIVLSK